MSKVCIVVPIYNVEKYLRTCFDSLLAQKYDDYYIMAVNDGSPDNSQTIIDEYAKRYPDRIKAVKKENGGYGSVLEYAIKNCNTEYFLVCDPDDYIAEDSLMTLTSLALKHNSDITIGSKYFIYDGLDQKDYDPAYNKKVVSLKTDYQYKKNTDDYKDLYFIDPSPHSKLYRTELCKDIIFPHKVSYTDNILFFVSLSKAERVSYTDKALSYYLVDRPGNTMTDVREKAVLGHIEVFKNIISQVKDADPVFYYRMYESFKFILVTCNRLSTKEEYENCYGKCYELVEMLLPHKSELLAEYKRLSSTSGLERIRDLLTLNKLTSRSVYNFFKNRAVKNFKN